MSRDTSQSRNDNLSFSMNFPPTKMALPDKLQVVVQSEKSSKILAQFNSLTDKLIKISDNSFQTINEDEQSNYLSVPEEGLGQVELYGMSPINQSPDIYQ